MAVLVASMRSSSLSTCHLVDSSRVTWPVVADDRERRFCKSSPGRRPTTELRLPTACHAPSPAFCGNTVSLWLQNRIFFFSLLTIHSYATFLPSPSNPSITFFPPSIFISIVSVNLLYQSKTFVRVIPFLYTSVREYRTVGKNSQRFCQLIHSTVLHLSCNLTFLTNI